jgi:uncharacterized protein YdhG (YjbR/CyaY superfamily)
MEAPASVEDYLAALPARPRAALERLRQTIQAAAPEATEAIGHLIPTFRDHGQPLVAYASFKDRCGFFPRSTRIVEMHREELEPYYAGKGTLHFTAERPLPTAGPG